jgi:rubredoxin
MSEDTPIAPVKEFDANPDCPKCVGGKDDLEFTYCTGSVKGSLCQDLPANFEHLHAHCNVCGYDYLSDTKDAEDRREAEKKAEEETATEVGFAAAEGD